MPGPAADLVRRNAARRPPVPVTGATYAEGVEGRRGRSAQVEPAADDLGHDLRRAAVDPLDAVVDVSPGDRVLEHVAVAAVELDARVDHAALHLGGPQLRLRG